jgi:hypothetical protein
MCRAAAACVSCSHLDDVDGCALFIWSMARSESTPTLGIPVRLLDALSF